MPSRMTSCSFTGHRPIKLPWGNNEKDARCIRLKQRLQDVLELAYQQGYRHFICGMAQGCDLYFCEQVTALRQKHGGVTLEAAIPCMTQSDSWPKEDRLRYQSLLAQCDMETLVQEKYSSGCMQRRNRYMVDHSSLLIAVHDGLPGGTRSTILYALQQGVQIVDIRLVIEI